MELVPKPDTKAELIRSLEQLSGRSIRSRADAQDYVRQFQASVGQSAGQGRWTFARHTILATGLLVAFLQYYLIDVCVQIVSMPSITFLAPVSNPPQLHSLDVLRRFT